jgi:hypothetical protein
MPTWLFHGWTEDAVAAAAAAAAAKAIGMYAVALAGLRLAPRRTPSQWTAIDVAAAVALGAVIGRTAIAGDHHSLSARPRSSRSWSPTSTSPRASSPSCRRAARRNPTRTSSGSP